ncbi:UNVERIFIED_CONTAM: hypothetical protein GTU68_032827 [Idotea baltica]|nr:hypothetical protein [Idotea baltica]
MFASPTSTDRSTPPPTPSANPRPPSSPTVFAPSIPGPKSSFDRLFTTKAPRIKFSWETNQISSSTPSIPPAPKFIS